MAFNSIKIIGNGVAQTAITNTHIVESVVHSLLAYNTSGSTTSFSIAVDGSTVVTQSIAAGGSYTLPIKLNVPVGASMTVTAATGVDVTVNYYSQAIDAVAGVNAVQALVTEAEAHVASIPDGTINDSITTAVDTWSSSKISSEITGIPQVTVNNTLTSTSTTEALSAAQGKVLQDTKQPTLVSGTNIKTVNGNSVLGSGDLTVGGGSMILLSTITASDSATVSFDGLFTTAYSNYIVVAKGVWATSGNVDLLMQFAVSGVYKTDTSYNSTRLSGNPPVFIANEAAAGIRVTTGLSNTAGTTQKTMFTAHLSNPNDTQSAQLATVIGSGYSGFSSAATNPIFCAGACLHTGGFSGVRFLCSSGGLNGTFSLYGIKTS